MGKDKSLNLTQKEYGEVVYNFLKRQEQFKEDQASFEMVKKQFYSFMEEYFEDNDVADKASFPIEGFADSSLLVVTKVQKSVVDFDVQKLEDALGKENSKGVIIKEYQIMDFEGLVEYLKSCGVSPKLFKKFIKVNKTVDTKKLDNLEELGRITVKQLDGCYTVKRQNPYFKVALK